MLVPKPPNRTATDRLCLLSMSGGSINAARFLLRFCGAPTSCFGLSRCRLTAVLLWCLLFLLQTEETAFARESVSTLKMAPGAAAIGLLLRLFSVLVVAEVRKLPPYRCL